MSTSRSSPSSRYHHGDLRNALLTAAERIIDTDVRREFSLRELAREAGVSHAAPYKHFADRAQLVEALAIGWMADFVDAQAAVVGGTDPRADLLAAGAAYVEWATTHPSRFTVIFDPAVNQGTAETGFGAQAARHEALLVRLVDAVIRDGGLTGPPDVAARRLWATAHGLANLVVLGLVDVRSVPTTLDHAVR